jgi:hypothetical protein
MKTNRQQAAIAAQGAAQIPPASDGPIFSFIRRSRVVVLTSPLWLGAIMIGLNMFGGPRIRAVIDFVSGIPR